MRNILFLLLLLPAMANAQREAAVHMKSSFVVSDNDHITLREAKQKCIENAKAEAIKSEFGEEVISDVIDSNVESDGSTAGSYFWENTAAMAKAEWLGDTQEPKIDVEYKDGNLVFSAEVWGLAREIVKSKIDLDLSVLKDISGHKGVTTSYENKERIYIRFSAPADGYLAVYLTVGDGNTTCLLPYPNDSDGRFPIKAGKDYLLFDKEADPTARTYRLTTGHKKEYNQLVIIYSPNAFTKCNIKSANSKQLGTIATKDFEKWLLTCQHSDKEMVVNRKTIRIQNANAEE